MGAESESWRQMYADHWHERVSIRTEDDELDELARRPRRVGGPAPSHRHHRVRHQHIHQQQQEPVLPREIPLDELPSTPPQLNAIMDRAMAKVKTMLGELEKEKGTVN